MVECQNYYFPNLFILVTSTPAQANHSNTVSFV